MLKTAFENLRSRSPLIHNITNYVTVNDCANMVLACGASPIMADDAAEVEDITTICGGLNINIGTLNSRTITSMLLAGKKANQLGRGHHQGRGCRCSRQGDRGEFGQRRGLCKGFCRPHRRGGGHYRRH